MINSYIIIKQLPRYFQKGREKLSIKFVIEQDQKSIDAIFKRLYGFCGRQSDTFLFLILLLRIVFLKRKERNL